MNLDIPHPKIGLDDFQLERLFTIIPALIVILGGVGVLCLYFSVKSLLPESETEVDIPELRAKVSVTRDVNGVPTIMAESEEDAALVLGYVMAQDRLWQMDYLRRAGEGRLADILGKAYLPRDEVVRLVRRSPGLAEELSHLDPEESLWLDKFVQGINRFIENHKKKYPLEFSFLDYKPQPFSRRDINSIICAVAWDSSVAVRQDPLLNKIAGKFGMPVINELLPLNSVGPKPIIPSELAGWEPKGLLFDNSETIRRQGVNIGFHGGCSWGIRPERSSAGVAVLCNVVYQNLSAPPFWYRSRLSAGDFLLAGAFIPGVPVALSGANRRFSWASVHVPIDDADLYLEQVNCDDECRYYRPDGWRRCEKIEENFTVSGGARQPITLLRTDTGPIVSNVEKGRAMALRWTGLAGTGLFQCMYHVNRAADSSDLRKAASSQIAPLFEIVWADSAGNIGSQIAGKIPVRPSSSDGVIALPAWTGVHGWHGFVPSQDLPSVTNPPEGYVAGGEGTFAEHFYPFVSTFFEDIARRQDRVSELLKVNAQQNRENLGGIALDSYSSWAALIVPRIATELEKGSEYSPLETKALEVLKTWNFIMDKDSAGAAVFNLWYDSFLKSLLREMVGDELYQELSGHPQLMAVAAQKKLVRAESSESKDSGVNQLVTKSFHTAISNGRKILGDEPEKWRWGRLHTVEFQHPLAARSGLFGVLFDVGPLPVSGSWDTVKASNWSPTNFFRETSGCSLTQIVEMSPKPVLLSSVPLGNSSHFFSSSYRNQVTIWQKGRLSSCPVMPEEHSLNGYHAIVFAPMTQARSMSR